MIAYASRTGTRRNLAALREHGWRLLLSPAGVLRTEGFPYALDNGAWSAHQRGARIDLPAFEAALNHLGRAADWVVVPDIVMGGLASLDLSREWLPRVLGRAQVALLAVQDGMHLDHVVPLLGPGVGIFVGGSTEWKESSLPMWGSLSRRGVWVHVGRVNTASRIRLCAAANVTSFDGSGPSRFAAETPRLDAARRQPDLLALL